VRLCLDTNRYVDLCKGVEATVRLVSVAEVVLLPFVVVAELRAGFAFGRRTAENEKVLRRFLLKEGVSVLYADDQTTHHYAAAYRQLRHQGTPARPTGSPPSCCSTTCDSTTATGTFDHLPQIARV